MILLLGLVVVQVAFVVAGESSIGPKLPPRPIACPSINCPGRFVDCKRIKGCLFCSCAPLCQPKVPCPPDCVTVTFKGCPVSCKCKAAPLPICPLAMCMMHCENGYEVDKNGCDMCKCKPDPVPVCPLVMCAMFCENGFQVDKNGCDMCKCKPFIPIEMRHEEAGAPGTK